LGRTILTPKRKKNIKSTYLGHILIFCEGMTEKLYLQFFTDILTKNKFNDIKIEIESANGNASRVFKFADSYLCEENNNRKYSNYKKYLIFDCDAPPNIQNIITDMLSSANSYEVIVSNFLFEIWLLMHFENVEKKLTKGEIYRRLENHLRNKYEKANEGLIREIIQKGSVEAAIDNAESLAKHYSERKINITENIEAMNPFTNIYSLVEQLLAAIS